MQLVLLTTGVRSQTFIAHCPLEKFYAEARVLAVIEMDNQTEIYERDHDGLAQLAVIKSIPTRPEDLCRPTLRHLTTPSEQST